MWGSGAVLTGARSWSPSVAFLTGVETPYQSAFYEALSREQGVRLAVLYGHTRRAADLAGVDVVAGVTRVIASLLRVPFDAAVLSDYSDPVTQVAARILCRRRIPRLFWLERPGMRRRGRWGTRLRERLQSVLREAAGVAAVGESAVASYRAICGPGVPVRSIPYGGELAPFRAVAQSVAGEPRVLFVGGLSRRKGVDLLLRAFREIRRRVPEARLRLVGDGALRRLAGRAALASPGVVERLRPVAWAGLPAHHAASQCFVLPSRHDGWGVALEEAMAAGRAVVTTSAVGAGELVRDGVNGLVVSPEEPDALADALTGLLRDGERRRALGAAAAVAVEGRGASQTAARWARLLQEVGVP